MNAAYDGLHFVLMHPFGTPGWRAGLPWHEPETAEGQPEAVSQEVADFE